MNIEDGIGNKQQRNCQGPALLTGFFKDTLFMEHLGKLPPRETADALVYRCLDSMEPFLSKTSSNYIDEADSSDQNILNSYYTCSNFQTRGIYLAAHILTPANY
jgi:hypothetical protein